MLGCTGAILGVSALSTTYKNVVFFDNSPLILCSAVAIFHFFGTLRFESRGVNFVSGSVLAMYLLDGLRPLLVPLFAPGTATHSLSYFPRMAGLTLVLMLCALVIDRARMFLLGSVEKRAFGL